MKANFNRIMCLKPLPDDNSNRITVDWEGKSYSINQSQLKKFNSGEEIKSALDLWTQRNLGYIIENIFFHKNRDGTWEVATGEEPTIWWEDEPTEGAP